VRASELIGCCTFPALFCNYNYIANHFRFQPLFPVNFYGINGFSTNMSVN
jgi:hypothetical protein